MHINKRLNYHFNKANSLDTEASFLDFHLSISNDIVSTKIYDKRDDFDFEIVKGLGQSPIQSVYCAP